jgi:hypothetical protein
MMTKYRPSGVWVAMVLACGGFLVVTFIYSAFRYPFQNSSPTDIVVDFCLLALTIFMFLYPTFGTVFTLRERNFCRTAYFLWRKCFSVEDIVGITYPPTFIAGNTHRTLTIIELQDGRYRQLTMSYPVFTEQTIVNVVRDLKRINPNIKLDDETEALLTKLH